MSYSAVACIRNDQLAACLLVAVARLQRLHRRARTSSRILSPIWSGRASCSAFLGFFCNVRVHLMHQFHWRRAPLWRRGQAFVAGALFLCLGVLGLGFRHHKRHAPWRCTKDLNAPHPVCTLICTLICTDLNGSRTTPRPQPAKRLEFRVQKQTLNPKPLHGRNPQCVWRPHWISSSLRGRPSHAAAPRVTQQSVWR
jgi:hypothetical protein